MTPQELIQQSFTPKHSKGVYFIYCAASGKGYIGSSLEVKKRISKHKSMLKNDWHENSYLQASYNKYGIQSFCFVQLEECEDVVVRENFYIDSLDKSLLFNLQYPANNYKGGHKASLETKAKKLKTLLGNTYALGFKHSEETKKLWSEQRKGHKAWNKGIPMNEWIKSPIKRRSGDNHSSAIPSEIALKVYADYVELKGDRQRARGSRSILAKKYDLSEASIKTICNRKHFIFKSKEPVLAY